MSALPISPIRTPQESCLRFIARYPRLRPLAWEGNILYASRGYEVLRAQISDPDSIVWQPVGAFRPSFLRRLSVQNRLTARLFRDGFHALAVLPSGDLIGAVPGSVVALRPREKDFRITHVIKRGTRPLHITAAPDGRAYWGEYFDNSTREEVRIYASSDQGTTWDVAYTFPKGSIRHVHNIVHDPWGNCLWVLTGDCGNECRILRASCDFRDVETVLQGNQQARAVAFVAMEDGLYFSTDTPLETNCIYRLTRGGTLTRLTEISSSSIYGCRVRNRIFFSTMVEPSKVNLDRRVRIFSGQSDGWNTALAWRKDNLSMRFFQYGNAFLPDGRNDTSILAVSTIAVHPDDQIMTLYRVQ
jgi:hypothetical protein